MGFQLFSIDYRLECFRHFEIELAKQGARSHKFFTDTFVKMKLNCQRSVENLYQDTSAIQICISPECTLFCTSSNNGKNIVKHAPNNRDPFRREWILFPMRHFEKALNSIKHIAPCDNLLLLSGVKWANDFSLLYFFGMRTKCGCLKKLTGMLTFISFNP